MSKADPWAQPTENIAAVRRPAQSGHRRGPSLRLLLALSAALLLALGLAASALAYYTSQYEGRMYPGVRALGVDLAGLTPKQARHKLLDRAAAYGRDPLTLQQGQRLWSVTPEQLGLELQADKLVEQAYSRGRTGSMIEQWRQRLPIVGASTEINPRYVLDRGKISQYVQGVAADIKREPVNSKLTLVSNGALIASPEAAGQQLDSAATEEKLFALISSLRTEDIKLPVKAIAPSRTRQDWRDARLLASQVATSPATLRLGDRQWTLSPQQLAGAITVEKGRSEVVGRFDSVKLRKLLLPIAADVRVEPKNATLSIQDTRAVLVPEKMGTQLQIEEGVRSLLESLPAERKAALSTQPIPARLTAKHLAPAKEKLDRLFAAPIMLSFQDETWTVPVETLESWTTLSVDEKRRAASVQLDAAAAQAFVAEIAPQIAQEAEDGALTWNDGLVVTKSSQDGYALRTEDATSELLAAVFSPDHALDLPVTVTKPRVPTDDLAALGIKEVIGEGTSKFEGSPPERVSNIRTAAGYLNDTVVAPDEMFSFNESLGEISKERGYKEGLTILADETVPGIGGGVCQVSTTTFRAAFWAGLPINERNQHSYLVYYYQLDGSPEGFDAAVYQPWVDLKWTNNTDHHILVRTSLKKDTLTVRLYGTKTGVRVERADPVISNRVKPLPDRIILDKKMKPGTKEQTEWAHEGMDVAITRTVYKLDGQVLQQTFTSRYKPWGNVFKVGPPLPKKKQTPNPSDSRDSSGSDDRRRTPGPDDDDSGDRDQSGDSDDSRGGAESRDSDDSGDRDESRDNDESGDGDSTDKPSGTPTPTPRPRP